MAQKNERVELEMKIMKYRSLAEFARTKVAEGLNVSAGTINPHLPKRTIAPTRIHRWLEENSSIK
jgi:hypothetical protein